jgi:hypothetical protein
MREEFGYHIEADNGLRAWQPGRSVQGQATALVYDMIGWPMLGEPSILGSASTKTVVTDHKNIESTDVGLYVTE